LKLSDQTGGLKNPPYEKIGVVIYRDFYTCPALRKEAKTHSVKIQAFQTFTHHGRLVGMDAAFFSWPGMCFFVDRSLSGDCPVPGP
jgi:hypothetical protein